MLKLVAAGSCAIVALALQLSAASAQEAEQADLWLGVRELRCSDSTVTATFFVPPLADDARGRLTRIPSTPAETWIDLSLADNGFLPGTFIGHGPHAASADHQAIEWSGLRPGALHFYRINARVGSQWYEVARGRFETPDCVDIMRMACDRQNQVAVTFLLREPRVTEGAVASDTFLDLTLRRNGFSPGTFLGHGPFREFAAFPPSGQPFEWNGLLILNRHYWRTNAFFRPFGWITQRSGSFLTPDCNTLARTA
jgi:hypothetical protein